MDFWDPAAVLLLSAHAPSAWIDKNATAAYAYVQRLHKEYPSNIGKKWTSEEERILLDELENNIELENIAENHRRTIGGINSRRKEIAYKLYSENNNTIAEIVAKTKLDIAEVSELIKIKDKQNKSKQVKKESENGIVNGMANGMANGMETGMLKEINNNTDKPLNDIREINDTNQSNNNPSITNPLPQENQTEKNEVYKDELTPMKEEIKDLLLFLF